MIIPLIKPKKCSACELILDNSNTFYRSSSSYTIDHVSHVVDWYDCLECGSTFCQFRQNIKNEKSIACTIKKVS